MSSQINSQFIDHEEIVLDGANMDECNMYEVPPIDVENYDLCIVFPVKKKMQQLDSEEFSVESPDDDGSVLSEDGAQLLSNIISAVGKKFVYLYLPPETRKLFVLVKARLSSMKSKAEKDNEMLLYINGNKLREYCLHISTENPSIEPIFIPHKKHVTSLDPYEHVYLRYISDEAIQALYYHKDKDALNPFSKALRLKVLQEELLIDCDDPGIKKLSLNHFLKSKVINDFFPILNENEIRMNLTKIQMPWKDEGLRKINENFGDMVTLFFWFSGFLSYYLLYPTIAGLLLQGLIIYRWIQGNNSTYYYYIIDVLTTALIPGFSLFICFWIITIQPLIIKYEKITAVKFNMGNILVGGASQLKRLNDDEDRSEIRYHFKGPRGESCIDGKEIMYVDRIAKYELYFVTFVISTLALALSLSALVIIYYCGYLLWTNTTLRMFDVRWFISIGTAIQIMFCNHVFKYISFFLTDGENHRTEQQFNNAVCVKIFLFQFFNTFTSYYYLAFGAIYAHSYNNKGFYSIWNCWGSDEFIPTGCQTSLTINVLIILSVQIIFGLLPEYVISYSLYQLKGNSKNKYPSEYNTIHNNDLSYREEENIADERKSGNEQLSGLYPNKNNKKQSFNNVNRPEYQNEEAKETVNTKCRDVFFNPVEMDLKLLLNPYKYLRRKYCRTIILLATALLFSSYLPGAFLLVLLANIFEMKGIYWRLINVFKRPMPAEATSIGVWQRILDIIVIVTIITNGAIAVFTTDQFTNWSLEHQLCLFIGFVTFCFTYKYILAILYSDTPREVIIQQKRCQFLTDKIILKVPDRVNVARLDIL